MLDQIMLLLTMLTKTPTTAWFSNALLIHVWVLIACTHLARHSAASSHTRTTLSTSSAFTWKMGALRALAMSVQYGEERDLAGSVVKATCTVLHVYNKILQGPLLQCLLVLSFVVAGAWPLPDI